MHTLQKRNIVDNWILPPKKRETKRIWKVRFIYLGYQNLEIRELLTKFRISNRSPQTNKGRYNKIPRNL